MDGKAAEISALLSENVSKYEILTGKDVLPEKDLLEKAATMKNLNILFQAKNWEKTSVAEKQYKKLDNNSTKN